MDRITIDFETYYDKDYTLSKMTTQEYIEDPRFEIIMAGYSVNGNKPQTVAGDWYTIQTTLAAQVDWSTATLVCHNTIFDGAILAWKLGLVPKQYFCTMMGARPNVVPFSATGKMSLAEVGETLGLPMKKGTTVEHMKGVHQRDLFADPTKLQRYVQYCKNDVAMADKIYCKIAMDLPKSEQWVLDLTLRKFIMNKDHQLWLDYDVLETALAKLKLEKEAVLGYAGLESRDVLMSNVKFADALRNLGVEPPVKISPTTQQQTYAFAKTDPGMRHLLHHENVQVRLLAQARVAHKSTIEETRLQRFMNVASLAKPLAVPLLYYGAHTGRFSGLDKMNLQNLGRKSPLRAAIKTVLGFKLIVGDLSQIEARITAALAGQQDLLNIFAATDLDSTLPDVYETFAGERVYGIDPADVTDEQRFVGKMCILGLGFNMGPDKFRDSMLEAGVTMSEAEAKRIVKTYRHTYQNIVQLWKRASRAIEIIVRGGQMQFGPCTVTANTVTLPNGMKIHYPQAYIDGQGECWYKSGTKLYKLYGGKLVENIVQALARIVLTTAELRLAAKGYQAAMSVHDELIYTVEEDKASLFALALNAALTYPVSWLPNLPLAADINIGDNYAEAK